MAGGDMLGAGPCTGLRVIDMTALISGPFCSQILADLGAEVIRIESEGSDVMRFVQPSVNGLSAYFEQVNRGKKSFSVDIKSDAGREQVRQLAASADIFLQNSRPGVMERLGFGYEELKAANPRLIYLSISGFGEDGSLRDRPAYDQVVQGVVGFMPLQGSPEEPQAAYSVVADKVTAIWAANSALAALLDRERNGGVGQKVSVNMTAGYAAFMLIDSVDHFTFRDHPFAPPPPRNKGPFETLATADGQVIGLVLQPRHCVAMCKALGCPDVAEDPRFQAYSSIYTNMEALYAFVAPYVASLTTDAFMALMVDANVPFGRVNDVATFVGSQEAEASETFSELLDPDYGAIRHLNYPARFERSSARPRRRAPLLGEHNSEILAELDGGAPAVG